MKRSRICMPLNPFHFCHRVMLIFAPTSAVSAGISGGDWMQPRTIRLIGAIASWAVAIPVFAQYGYPLKGSWSGDWWIVKGKENHILLDFNWDGKTLNGTLNPGPDASPMQKLTLTPPDVISAGKAAIVARDAAVAKQTTDAAATAA